MNHDTQTVPIIIIIIFSLAIFFGFREHCKTLQSQAWRVEITYLNGQADTMEITLQNGLTPQVQNGGCLYAGDSISYICGVRKINYSKLNPH